MKDNVLFSIVIPTYNRAHLISVAIDSVLEQKYQNFELIIVDDGSTDDTESVVRNFQDKRLSYYKKENGERAAARNFGNSKATGDYITFFDSDDILYPNHLEEALKIITTFSSPEWFHLGYTINDELGKVIKSVMEITGDLNQKLVQGNFLSCNGVFLRKDVAKEFQFNEDRRLSALEDWELWLRIAAKYKLVHSNVVTSSIVNHESRSVLATNKDNLLLRFQTFLSIVESNMNVLDFYSERLAELRSSCYSYISLHLALTKKYKLESFKYLMKAIVEHPFCIFKRRFLAILKHLIF